ncbi:MAG TPA: NAD(P)-binding domain-containing protein, partial [Acidimicrobiia bacterium]|nr:NAD(P)-binding domain-containing protein [Acidimicrobiia bacterium]
MTTLALIGGGKMGEALLGGLIDGGWDPETLAVAEVVAERRHAIESRFTKVRVVPNPAWAVADAEIVVVAVKPADVAAALAAAEPVLEPGALVLSIAAGVTLAALEAAAPGRPVVRAMPNTPAVVGLGAAAIAAGHHAGEEHLARA